MLGCQIDPRSEVFLEKLAEEEGGSLSVSIINALFTKVKDNRVVDKTKGKLSELSR
jgi:hypothetical protein